MNPYSLPDSLLPVCNEAVEHAHGRGSVPKGLSKLKQWLEGDGWDELLAAWVDERMALRIQEKSHGFFSDAELRAYEGLDKAEELSNDVRVAYARERITEWSEDDDGYTYPSVHSFSISGRDGQTAVVGYLVEIHGQGGPAPVYCGLFKDADSFSEHLRGLGMVLSDEIDDLSDEAILKLWKWTKPKRTSSSNRKSTG